MLGISTKRKADGDEIVRAKKMIKVTVLVDPDEFRSGIVEMPAKQSISFNFFNSDACNKTIGPLAKALGMTVNAQSVSAEVTRVASEIRKIVSENIQNRMICLKCDSASRRDKKVFGINCQYLKNGVVHVQTLSMLEIFERQTTVNLKERILQVLEQYKISVLNVYGVTVDNGANMISCVKKLGNEQAVALNMTDDGNIEIHFDNNNIELEDSESDDDEDTEDDIASAEMQVNDIFLSTNAECVDFVRCGAHTIQLAVNGSISQDVSEQISSIRSKLQLLKTTQYRSLFTVADVPLPKISNATRWSSKYDMFENIVQHKHFYKTIGNSDSKIEITEEEWILIENFLEAFEPAHILTKELQKQNLIIGDMFRLIKVCQYKLQCIESKGNPLVTNLKKNLEQRVNQIFSSKAAKAALFFDPRWNFIDSPYLTKDDKAIAIVSISIVLF